MWRPGRTRARDLALAALIVALTVAIYAPVASHGFVNFDDNLYVTENPQVRRGLTLETMAWALTHFHASNWHPLTWWAHMLNVELFGLWAGGHHLSSLALHLVNALLLFGLLRHLTGQPLRSAFVAALFAVHPAHVESVAWVAELKDVLSTAFLFLTLAAYAGWAKTGRAGLYRLSLLLFALGLAAKPMLVTVPAILLLFDWWPLGRLAGLSGTEPPPDTWRRIGRLLLEKAPFAVLALASGVITLLAQQGAMVTVRALTPGERLCNSLQAYVRYIGAMFWPLDLAVYYPLRHPFCGDFAILSGALLAGGTAGLVLLARVRPWTLTGWGWFVVTLLPVIGWIQVGAQAMADRYTYVPYVGLFILLAWGGAWLLEGRPGWFRRWGLVAGALLLAASAVIAARQVTFWHDSITLFGRAVAVTRYNDTAHNNLASALLAAGREAEAERHCRIAVDLNPNNAMAQSNLGTILFAAGRFEEAARRQRRAVELQGDSPDYLYKLGIACHKLDRLDEAMGWYCRALLRSPAHPEAHYYLGEILFQRNRPAVALRHFETAVRLNPDFPWAWQSLGRTLAGLGRLDEAAAAWGEAVRRKPDLVEARYNLGTWLAQHHRLDEAIIHLGAVVRLAPDDARARNNLGSALLLGGRAAEAIPHLEAALRLQPGYLQAAENLRRARELRDAP